MNPAPKDGALLALLKLSNHKSVRMKHVSQYQWTDKFSDLTIIVSLSIECIS